eukprot:CAMPEP_0178915148 /NCGR_PEP_ID=MMETSP0786-20121207/11853_1 /TAXON_ID=186022 /ORGANISM="Thalassionema frauenfeldii, Strain CCMP 1798" /LENGTH=430 /DNA_ID=CAMNT_0020588201 /DNA_START=53 /DNA_END=1345 /DNA_ORIENTATION=-
MKSNKNNTNKNDGGEADKTALAVALRFHGGASSKPEGRERRGKTEKDEDEALALAPPYHEGQSMLARKEVKSNKKKEPLELAPPYEAKTGSHEGQPGIINSCKDNVFPGAIRVCGMEYDLNGNDDGEETKIEHDDVETGTPIVAQLVPNEPVYEAQVLKETSESFLKRYKWRLVVVFPTLVLIVTAVVLSVVMSRETVYVTNPPSTSPAYALPSTPSSTPITTLSTTPSATPSATPSTAPSTNPSTAPSTTPRTTPTTRLDWCPSGITSISRSDNYNVKTEDDGDDPLIGSLDKIDKIIRIEVFRAKYFWYGMDYVVSKIRVAYRLKDGREVALTRGKHSDTTPFKTLEIPDGVYLTSANVMTNHDINVIDWVSFCLSDNSCYGPWGGPRRNDLEALGHDNGVIKCFFGDVGADWVTTLGCYYEICSEEV